MKQQARWRSRGWLALVVGALLAVATGCSSHAAKAKVPDDQLTKIRLVLDFSRPTDAPNFYGDASPKQWACIRDLAPKLMLPGLRSAIVEHLALPYGGTVWGDDWYQAFNDTMKRARTSCGLPAEQETTTTVAVSGGAPPSTSGTAQPPVTARPLGLSDLPASWIVAPPDTTPNCLNDLLHGLAAKHGDLNARFSGPGLVAAVVEDIYTVDSSGAFDDAVAGLAKCGDFSSGSDPVFKLGVSPTPLPAIGDRSSGYGFSLDQQMQDPSLNGLGFSAEGYLYVFQRGGATVVLQYLDNIMEASLNTFETLAVKAASLV